MDRPTDGRSVDGRLRPRRPCLYSRLSSKKINENFPQRFLLNIHYFFWVNFICWNNFTIPTVFIPFIVFMIVRYARFATTFLPFKGLLKYNNLPRANFHRAQSAGDHALDYLPRLFQIIIIRKTLLLQISESCK